MPVIWRLCSYFIPYFSLYLFPSILIASVKTLGLLGVFLTKKASQVVLSWEEALLSSCVCSWVGRRLCAEDHRLTVVPLSKVLSQELIYGVLPPMEPNPHSISLVFGSPLPYLALTLSMDI